MASPCATCGVLSTSTFNDGSPRWPPEHGHNKPVYGGAALPFTRLIVELDGDELTKAREAGDQMFADRKERGEAALMATYDPASAYVLGAQGEIAVARWAGVPWRPVFRGQKGTPDVAGMHVRTRRDPTFGLPVRSYEVKKRAPFVLVNGRLGESRHVIRGWIVGTDAKRTEWLADYGGHGEAYFVPPNSLRDAVELLTTHRATAGLPPEGA